MYQLYKYSTLSLQRNVPLSVRSLSVNSELTATEKTCLLCKHLNVNLQLQFRAQSSITNPNIKKTKYRSPKKKFFTDVLVVSDKFSGLRLANVIKFTPKQLNLLARTDLSLDELYKIVQTRKHYERNLSHTYSNLDNEGIESVSTKVPRVEIEIATTKLNPLSKNTNVKIDKYSNIFPRIYEDASNVNVGTNIINASERSKKLTKNIENINTYIQSPIFDKSELTQDVDDELDIDHENNAFQFKSMDVAPAFQPEVEVEMEEEMEVEESPVKEHTSKKVEVNPLQQRHRDEIAAKTLAAHMEVCNHLNKPNRGIAALYFHQAKHDKVKCKLNPMRHLSVYSTLLRGFAHRGDYVKIKEVIEIMRELQLKPDLHCYVAIFECLGRINVQNHYLRDIRVFVRESNRKNITFDDMMNNGVFLNDQRAAVLKAFKAYDNSYEPKYKIPSVQYKNRLVNHLNNNKQLNFKAPEESENNGLFTPNSTHKRITEQVKAELDGYVTVQSIERKAKPNKEILHCRNILEDHYKMWRQSAEEAFQRDLKLLMAKRAPLNIEVYLRSIPAKEIVDIIMEEAKRIAHGSETYSPEVSLLNKLLGKRVYSRYLIHMKQKTGVLEKMLKIHNKYCNAYVALHPKLDVLPEKEQKVNQRIQWQLIDHSYCKTGSTLSMGHQPWVPSTQVAVGKFLYHIIKHDIKIDVNSFRLNHKQKNHIPAFYTIFRSQGRLVKEEIKPHPLLSKLYKMSHPETLTFPTNEVPMVSPPIPWTSVNNGGYVITPTEVIRLPTYAVSQRKLMTEGDKTQLYPSLDALNQLASVPWKVNTKVLDIILDVFQKGGSAKLDVPEAPSSLAPPPPIKTSMDKAEKFQLMKLKLQHKRKKGEMYSLWCDCLYRLSLANHFRDDIFWLPHNMDFRGRVYPVPPHLNHLGSDLARSMLVFAEGRPLGPQGLDWLKIHLINLTGLKKRDAVRDRLAFANDIMDLILDSADHPLDGKMWWAESDEPWQTLACCIEIADVIRSGVDPTQYISHFPVHQDGSCNGLQHYAALGRDSAGAYSVNLAPCDAPQDVYSAVVALVEEQRAKDEVDGVQIAKTLNGFIKRKVIKQTIMTTVYGVTKFGARLQIAKQLKDIDDFPKEAVWAASAYLTGRTFESLRTMFTSTREIQDWFTECAKLISGVVGKHVEWITPLGLPVVQPYIKYKKIPSVGYEQFSLDQFERPNTVKQKNAFPPNFIHSLDSSHMMLTSLHCERAGITFVSVHDCYWTHPSTISIMNKICREQFVALHSEPILEDLSIFLYDKYGFEDSEMKTDETVSEPSKKRLNSVLKRLPQTGNFDIRKVLDSVYFFS